MNYKTLIIGALAILLLAGIAAFLLPKFFGSNDTYEAPQETTTDDSAMEEPTTTTDEEESETMTDEAGTTPVYGDKGGDTPVATGYTLAEVATHADETSCWTAIDGKVYDLTPFINEHPGGAENIMQLCGTDGTAAFSAQHGGQEKQANTLTEFYLGPLE